MFVTFEGLDGSGKSTQAAAARRGAASATAATSSPRASRAAPPLGERVRELLLHEGDVSPWAEAALFAAARARARRRRDRARRSSAAPTSSATATSTRRSPTRASRAGSALDRVLELNLQAMRRPAARPHVPAARRPRRGGAPASARTRDRIEREGDELPRARRRRLSRAGRGTSRSGSHDDRRHARRRAEIARGGAPTSFDSVPEQEEAKRLLRAALAEGPAHAYLFHGPAGVGKRATGARVRRRSCSATTRASSGARTPTSTCSSRSATRSGSTPSASCGATCTCGRSRPQRRVYLVFGAHLMNDEAADALLKDLEEPPEYAVIVLVADELGPLAGDDPLALPGSSRSGGSRSARCVRQVRGACAGALGGGGDHARARRRRAPRPGGAAARPARPRGAAPRCSRRRARSTRPEFDAGGGGESWCSRPRASGRPRPRSARRRRSRSST